MPQAQVQDERQLLHTFLFNEQQQHQLLSSLMGEGRAPPGTTFLGSGGAGGLAHLPGQPPLGSFSALTEGGGLFGVPQKRTSAATAPQSALTDLPYIPITATPAEFDTSLQASLAVAKDKTAAAAAAGGAPARVLNLEGTGPLGPGTTQGTPAAPVTGGVDFTSLLQMGGTADKFSQLLASINGQQRQQQQQQQSQQSQMQQMDFGNLLSGGPLGAPPSIQVWEARGLFR